MFRRFSAVLLVETLCLFCFCLFVCSSASVGESLNSLRDGGIACGLEDCFCDSLLILFKSGSSFTALLVRWLFFALLWVLDFRDRALTGLSNDQLVY